MPSHCPYFFFSSQNLIPLFFLFSFLILRWWLSFLYWCEGSKSEETFQSLYHFYLSTCKSTHMLCLISLYNGWIFGLFLRPVASVVLEIPPSFFCISNSFMVSCIRLRLPPSLTLKYKITWSSRLFPPISPLSSSFTTKSLEGFYMNWP